MGFVSLQRNRIGVFDAKAIVTAKSFMRSHISIE